MDYEEVKEWYTKQYKDPKHQRLLQFDVDCVDWLIAEVERLRGEIQEASVERAVAYQEGYADAKSEGSE